jgi:hypothetical protein
MSEVQAVLESRISEWSRERTRDWGRMGYDPEHRNAVLLDLAAAIGLVFTGWSKEREQRKIWLVWNNESRIWWRPNSAGYTGRIEDAGRYTLAEAASKCSLRSRESFIPEMMVPAPEYLQELGVAVPPQFLSPGARAVREDLLAVGVVAARDLGLVVKDALEAESSRDARIKQLEREVAILGSIGGKTLVEIGRKLLELETEIEQAQEGLRNSTDAYLKAAKERDEAEERERKTEADQEETHQCLINTRLAYASRLQELRVQLGGAEDETLDSAIARLKGERDSLKAKLEAGGKRRQEGDPCLADYERQCVCHDRLADAQQLIDELEAQVPALGRQIAEHVTIAGRLAREISIAADRLHNMAERAKHGAPPTEDGIRLLGLELRRALTTPVNRGLDPGKDEGTRIMMLLWCPRCQTQHVDEPEPETGWTNPPHRTHKCKTCGHLWRPSDWPTAGVAAIETGSAVSARPYNPSPAQAARELAEALQKDPSNDPRPPLPDGGGGNPTEGGGGR